ncbi:MAG TPA: outer membrane protein assembly factor BamA [Candidatus Methanoperedens sp.]|nr:outer membrane protein assembly factor BamA [Candidatus Methanoperedens sp.]
MRGRRRGAPPARAALLLLAAAVLSSLAAPLAARAEAPAAPVPQIREIVVTGTRMVEETTVRARIASREGGPYDPEQVSKDIRAIYELGSFADVAVDAEGFEGGLRLTFTLTERPLLRDVVFEGNKEIKSEDLREKAAFALNAPYNPAGVAAAVERVRTLYREKGYYQVLVRTDTEPAGEGQARLKVVIEEGSTFKLVEVGVRGAKALPEADVRRQLKTSPWTIFSWATDSGKFPPELLQEDRQRLVSYYQDHGYLEVRVGEPEVVVDDAARKVRVFFSVTEGAQFRLGATSLRGDDLVPLDEIRKLIGLKEGEVFRRSAFAQGLAAVNRRYASRGYAFVKVDYATKLDPAARTLAVTFLVDRGPEARIGRVTVSGNVTTRDRVIRRELTFAEGDVFNSEALSRSRQKVMNLGHFEQVDLVPRPRDESVIDVEIQVKERLTGMIEFGVTYSSEEKLMGRLRLAETNLFGRGQTLQLMVEYSGNRQSYSLTFYEPAIHDGPWSAGFSVYDTIAEYDQYDRKSVGGRLRLGRSLGEYVRGEVSAKHETVSVSNVAADASSYIKEQAGTATTNGLRLSLTRDTRDNFLNPSRGNRTSIAGEYAGGPLQGDNSFTKREIEHSTYLPLVWRFVGMVHGEYGAVDGFDGHPVPIYEKYFLGGSYTMRGFKYREVGPKDEDGEPKGGVRQLSFNTELIFQLIPEQGLNLVAFYDTGNVWEKSADLSFDDLRQSWGYGVRWMSPIGPMRFEWGYILNPREGEESQGFSFVIGGAF